MTKRMAFVIKVNRCVGCKTCVVACKMEHKVQLGFNRIRVLNEQGSMLYDKPVGIYPILKEQFITVPCQHCENPPCVDVCPTGASQKREDGIVFVDQDKCIGCQYCIWSCPYEARYRDPEKHVVDKCNMCMDRLDQGLEPMCVMTCPARAIVVGDLNDPNSEVFKLVNSHDVRVLRPDQGTNPSTFYIL